MKPTLVMGATGSQGGAVARALRARGEPVRALVRDPAAGGARALAALGVDLVQGDYDDPASLSAAVSGADAVFSVQPPPGAEDRDSERRQGEALVVAAVQAGVRRFIHTSVAGAGDFDKTAAWASGRFGRNYWRSKADVEAMVRGAGFPVHTILRPGFFMENFLPPMADYMFADLGLGALTTAIEPKTVMHLVAVDDIAQTAVAALDDADRFGGAVIELAGDLQTMGQIAQTLSEATGSVVELRVRSPEALVAEGCPPRWVQTQEWYNAAPCPARPEIISALGLSPTRFLDWARRHASRLGRRKPSPT
jgi:uncharacterized protein YbjT (DUF2867 family)